jgi:sugar/nucleoside kinase (ribokinase family)
MAISSPTFIVAGHVDTDIHPAIPPLREGLLSLLVPGKLVEVGVARVTTGGAVANTGLALHRLGFTARLVGKVGNDAFGRLLLDNFRRIDERLADSMIVDPASATAYSICITPPGIDRMFWHCPGANHTFCSGDVTDEQLRDGDLFHFGYPPLMRRMYAAEGAELMALFKRAKAAGLTTSLDMTLPDPDAESGRLDWTAILRRVLPYVDLFVPSLDEIAFMLDPVRGMQIRENSAAGVPLGGCDANEVQRLCTRLTAMGTAVVMLKLGKQGAYLQATSDASRLGACGRVGPADPASWAGAALQAACFTVHVAGTTGAGDCTIAGFLAAVAQGCVPAEALRMAVAVGSTSVEGNEGARDLPTWQAIAERLARGWPRDPSPVSFPRVV